MTCTIRVIDPMTGASLTRHTPTLEEALLLIAGIYDKHIVILDDDTNATLEEVFPVPPDEQLERLVRRIRQ